MKEKIECVLGCMAVDKLGIFKSYLYVFDCFDYLWGHVLYVSLVFHFHAVNFLQLSGDPWLLVLSLKLVLR